MPGAIQFSIHEFFNDGWQHFVSRSFAKLTKCPFTGQGMCYGEPELKAEDKGEGWEKDSDGYDSEVEQLIEANKEVATTEPEVCPSIELQN